MIQSALHAAIIMDGNGRWADLRGLPRIVGHRRGAEALRAVVHAAPECGIGLLTAYAFSSDNWKRPRQEVDALMALLAGYLRSEARDLAANGVRLSVIGRRDRIPDPVVHAIEQAESTTHAGNRLHLQLAVDYSSRDTILRSMPHTSGLSEPVDLLIRTGGEQRLSDFLLWESAYAELIFTRCLWPDFNRAELLAAVSEFRRRTRRFGGLPEAFIEQPAQGERWLS